MFDFDRVIERRGTHSSKWDMIAKLSTARLAVCLKAPRYRCGLLCSIPKLMTGSPSRMAATACAASWIICDQLSPGRLWLGLFVGAR